MSKEIDRARAALKRQEAKLAKLTHRSYDEETQLSQLREQLAKLDEMDPGKFRTFVVTRHNEGEYVWQKLFMLKTLDQLADALMPEGWDELAENDGKLIETHPYTWSRLVDYVETEDCERFIVAELLTNDDGTPRLSMILE